MTLRLQQVLGLPHSGSERCGAVVGFAPQYQHAPEARGVRVVKAVVLVAGSVVFAACGVAVCCEVLVAFGAKQDDPASARTAHFFVELGGARRRVQ